MSLTETVDHKFSNLVKIKERELELLQKGMLSVSQRYTCSKHLDYYNEQKYRLKCYIEKKDYPFNNEINIIGSFNENTKEVIEKWKLCDGQGLAVYLDFEKGCLYIGDIL